jgi:cytosine deaminase
MPELRALTALGANPRNRRQTVAVLIALAADSGAGLARPSHAPRNRRMDPFLRAAIDEARQGLAEGGIPIGSVLVIDGRIVGRGHNRRVQQGSAILHAEMDCIERAGRLEAADYRRATLYSTLSPCDMCSGTALLYGIPRIVIGEDRTFRGPEDYVRSRGVELTIVDDPECVQLMREFIAARPELWNEDIGV